MANAVKLNDVIAVGGSGTADQEGEEDDLGDDGGESFKDSEGPVDQQ